MKGPPSPVDRNRFSHFIAEVLLHLVLVVETRRDRQREDSLILANFENLAGIVEALPLGRVSILSELAGRGDRLINMHIESGWFTAAPLVLSWRLSGRGGKERGLLSSPFPPVYVKKKK